MPVGSDRATGYTNNIFLEKRESTLGTGSLMQIKDLNGIYLSKAIEQG
jgi:hypothetical protein